MSTTNGIIKSFYHFPPEYHLCAHFLISSHSLFMADFQLESHFYENITKEKAGGRDYVQIAIGRQRS